MSQTDRQTKATHGILHYYCSLDSTVNFPLNGFKCPYVNETRYDTNDTDLSQLSC